MLRRSPIMRRLIITLAVCLPATGCVKQPPAPPSVKAPPVLRLVEDRSAARRQAKEQNRPLVVLSVLGDYKKHC